MYPCQLIWLVVGRLSVETMGDGLTFIILELSWIFSQGAWTSIAKNVGKLKIYITFIETNHQWKTTKKQTKNLVIYMQKWARKFHFLKKNVMTHERDYPLLNKLPFYALLGLFLKLLLFFKIRLFFSM